jgi:ABC-type Fe2+-enterobactin transport system substrate-binding protein
MMSKTGAWALDHQEREAEQWNISTLTKTIVVKIKGQWQLLQVEEGRVFTGEDHNIKAIKYFDKKVKENNVS